MLQVERNLQGTVDLAVLHEVASRDTFIRVMAMVVGVDIFGQIELDISESDPLPLAAAGVFLYDLEMNPQLL